MIALLQWPSCWMSPSRNHTPGTISFTELGCASPRVTANSSISSPANMEKTAKRIGRIVICPQFNAARQKLQLSYDPLASGRKQTYVHTGGRNEDRISDGRDFGFACAGPGPGRADVPHHRR